MRLVVLKIFLLVAAASASPLLKSAESISPLRELGAKVDINDPSHRWALIPDGDGKMHLIDTNPYQAELEPFFNAESDVVFLLFTPRSPGGERLYLDAGQIRNTQFNPGAPCRFIIHGWNNDENSDVNTVITSAYLSRGDFNVHEAVNSKIVIGWGLGANTIDYGAARNRINDVSTVAARFIDLLISNGLTNHGRISIIGHSLGGHTAGLTGKKVSGGRVQTIIGLDPAGPMFNTNAPNERIADQDANYVEIIHTNGWTLGFGEPLGQADFFPNYGRSQPGCGVDLIGTCAHGRAPLFFAESVRNNQFVATRCASFDEVNNGRCTWQSGGHLMGGEPANAGLNGYFYVTTNSNSPFGQGW